MSIQSILVCFALSLMVAPTAPVEWQADTTADLGDLQHKEPTVHVFEYKNMGQDSLFIDNVRTSCGCTSPDWEEIAVAPDSIGKISIEYDADDLGYVLPV